jgi:outer membrane protein, heavy metal efflux system
MKYIKIYTIATLLCIISTVTASSAQEQTVTGDTLTMSPLNQYLKISAENNPLLKSTFNQYLAAMERLPQAATLPDPKFLFSYFISPTETRVGPTNLSFGVSQAFPWFGQLGEQENAVAQLAKGRYEIFEDERNKLFFNVRTTYYEFYVLEAAIRITAENIKLLQSFRGLANVRLEAGTGSAVDLLRVEMDMAELDNDLKYLKDTREPILAKFLELLNVDSVLTIDTPDTLLLVNFDETKNILLDSIVTQNPSLRELDFKVESLNSEIEVARKMGLPSFSVGLSYTNVGRRTDVPDFSGNGSDVFLFPQIGVQIPLYRGKYKSMITEKEYLKTSVAEQKADKLNRLNTSLEKGWRDYLDAQRRVTLNKYLIELADQSLDILLAEFTSAGKDFEEVLRMDRQLLNYELELEKARADQNTAVAFILYLTGRQ